MRSFVVAILGPTAAGKSTLAVQLAEKIGGELICLDSTTVYRHFDIGTNKPSKEDQQRIPHHLLDILSPSENFSAHHFVERATASIEQILGRDKIPIIVGGTYFYLKALQFGMYSLPPIPVETPAEIELEFFEEESLNTQRMHQELEAHDPQIAKKIHPNDRYRLVRALSILRTTGELPSQLKPEKLPGSRDLWLKYAITLPRHTINDRIVNRTERMLSSGLVDETKKLMEKYPTARALKSIGYAECVLYLKMKLTEKQLRAEIIEKTRKLAKRQNCWLRSDPEIRFIDHRDLERISLEIENLKTAILSGAIL